MKNRFNWRSQYDADRDIKEGDLAILRCEDDSLTAQAFAQDADLNVIAKRFGINAIPTSPLDPALFRDTTGDPDLRDILEARRIARDHFQALPAKLRRRFHDDPSELWEFINDPDNGEEAVRLGILKELNPAPAAASAAPGPTASSAAPASQREGTKEPLNDPPNTSQKGT